MRRRAIIALAAIAIVAMIGHGQQHRATFKVHTLVTPEWFGLTPESPESVKRGGVPLPEVTTDFYGRPRDPNHPSLGAIEWPSNPAAARALAERIIRERTKSK